MEKMKKFLQRGGERRMKKVTIGVLAGVVSFLFSPVAFPYLTPWYFNPWGTDFSSAIQITDHLDIQGNTFIQNDLSNGTFQEWGTFVSRSYDGGISYGSNIEITSIFSAGGNVTPTFFTFTYGNMEIYADTANFDYGTNTDPGVYGADNGALIGQFTLLSGGGMLNNYLPVSNGMINAVFVANWLESGYWFDALGRDLSQWTITSGSAPILTLGLVTTNASVSTPNSTLINEYDEWIGLPGGSSYSNNSPSYFFVSNGGQFRVDVIPEPTSLLLIGSGLLGLAGIGIRRRRRIV